MKLVPRCAARIGAAPALGAALALTANATPAAAQRTGAAGDRVRPRCALALRRSLRTFLAQSRCGLSGGARTYRSPDSVGYNRQLSPRRIRAQEGSEL
jgi:hypothetical protein